MRVERLQRPLQITESHGLGNSVELRLIFPCCQYSVRDALARTMSGLGAMNLSEDDTSSIELVLAEVLNNICEHAYRDSREGQIELVLQQNENGVRVRVTDRGHAMPQLTPPPGITPNPDSSMELQPEGGFGWFLIRRLTRNLTYMRHDDSNILSFEIEVRPAPRSN